MEPNAFINKAKQPTSAELSKALGPSKVLWDKLISDVSECCKIDDEEWNSYSLKAGWALRLKHKKRNILYLAPLLGSFQATLILGNKAVAAARKGQLPARGIKIIDEAKRYPEGTAIRMEVKNEKDVELMKQFSIIKSEN